MPIISGFVTPFPSPWVHNIAVIASFSSTNNVLTPRYCDVHAQMVVERLRKVAPSFGKNKEKFGQYRSIFSKPIKKVITTTIDYH